MEIFIEKENKTIQIELKQSKKLIEILNDLKIVKESIILVKNGEIALEEAEITNNDKLKILSVVSGG